MRLKCLPRPHTQVTSDVSNRVLLLCLWVALLGSALLSLLVGQFVFSVSDLLQALHNASESPAKTILLELRVPRTLLGILVGASMGLCGAALQGLLRNPLAEPGIIGVSGCAALGAVLVFYSGLAGVAPLALPFGGILGALLGVIIIYLLAGWRGTTLSVILAGVAVNAFAGALTALVLNLAESPFAFFEIVFWQMGSLADRSTDHLLLAAPLCVGGMIVLMLQRSALATLTLGEDAAVSLGVGINRLRGVVVLGTALAVGSAVAVSGVVGFVGLVVPHLLRPQVGHHPGRLLSVSALGGAVLVLLADVLVRLIPTGTELKLGVVTALIGAPFFVYLVLHLRRELR